MTLSRTDPFIPPINITARDAILVGEVKFSANRLYKNYVKPGGKKKQLDAICGFASKHVETDTAVFLSALRGNANNFQALKLALIEKGIYQHTLLLVYSLQRK